MKTKTFLFSVLLAFNTLFPQTEFIFKECLALKQESPAAFSVLSPDPVSALLIINKWKEPQENSSLIVEGTEKGSWQKIIAKEDGWFEDELFQNTYAYAVYNAESEGIALLQGMSHNIVYVNGVPRSGNPYQYKDKFEDWEPRFDYSLIPVKLKKGRNEFIFECRRGRLKAVLKVITAGVLLNTKDVTVPDIIRNDETTYLGAVAVINASERNFKDLFIKSQIAGAKIEYDPVSYPNPLSILKVPFHISVPSLDDRKSVELRVQIIQRTGSSEKILDSALITLSVKNKNELHKETFISRMDGSVQYYGVNPPEELNVDKPALFLSLHGAGVEAINQAGSYYRKNWGYIVSPTNRRPYGFNWENWGRIDALEVLDIVRKKFEVDENRIYLTGHSMGGHGTWHLGVNYADQFAAIAPSAGWISFWSYRVRSLADSSSKLMKMLVRSTRQSDTYALAGNLFNNGIYILHGGADDVVSPEQATSMVKRLSGFHKDFIYYEQPGAGHWWDNSDEDGADCVDWMPMFDFFSHHSLSQKERIREIDFTTANPAISSRYYWLEIGSQNHPLEFSRVKIKLDPGKCRFIGTTENVEHLTLDVSMIPEGSEVNIRLDSTIISGIKYPEGKKIFLTKSSGSWNLSGPLSDQHKNPLRYGTIKEAFNNNMVFVYGTRGNDEENKWAYEKARFDAERFWYQGNGNIPVISDKEFDLSAYKDRNIIIYGNSETNSAWNLLLKNSPVQVYNNKIVFGNKVYKGKDIACIMTYPVENSRSAVAGVISGTGITGMRLTNYAPYFNPANNLPDLTIFDTGILKSDEKGIRCTGFFGNDWSAEKGEFVENQ